MIASVFAPWIVLAGLTAYSQGDASPPTMQRLTLSNGAVIEGIATLGAEETWTVDLGFEVLSIPASAVTDVEAMSLSISLDAPDAVPDDAEGTDEPGPSDVQEPVEEPTESGHEGDQLWTEAPRADARDLDSNMDAVAEAVVLVRSRVGLGSGFMIHSEGYLISNDHVIEGSNELTVIVFRQATDGLQKDEYKHVRIIATAELLDLALLKIEPDGDEEFVTVPLGNSHALIQGEPVFAVGNPMGLERSLSEGIVALRSRLSGGQSYVQTTAALSPGNSGGPLFDMSGRVIGVNSLKIVAAGAEGLSFSIPINRVKAFIDDQEAYAFDPLNPNTGYRYYAPPEQPGDAPEGTDR